MATSTFVGVCVISLVLCVIQVVAVATPGWIVFGTGGEGSLYVGLFLVCVDSDCISKASYIYVNQEGGNVNVSSSYIAVVVLHIVGAILLFASFANSLRYYRSLPDGQGRSIVNRAAIMLCVASGCILAGVIWYYIYVKTGFFLVASSLWQELKFGYSFYLAMVTGVSSIFVAITMCGVARQMATPPVISTSVTPRCPQTIVVHSTTTNQAGYTYPMTSPVGIPQNDPAYRYDQ